MSANHVRHFNLHTQQQTLALKLAAGDRVQVVEGVIWVTLEGHTRDLWLRSHDCWTVPHGSNVWISAEPSARFGVCPVFSQCDPIP